MVNRCNDPHRTDSIRSSNDRSTNHEPPRLTKSSQVVASSRSASTSRLNIDRPKPTFGTADRWQSLPERRSLMTLSFRWSVKPLRSLPEFVLVLLHSIAPIQNPIPSPPGIAIAPSMLTSFIAQIADMSTLFREPKIDRRVLLSNRLQFWHDRNIK